MNLQDQITFVRQNLKHSIVLVGLMGAGKSSLGRQLAEVFGCSFIDSDDVIVAAEGMTIPDIFETYSEDYFRRAERDIIIDLLDQTPHAVIGTGGGAFINDKTRDVIKDKALSVFIKADIDVLTDRVGQGQGRPLLEGKDIKEVMSDLIESRYPRYEQAELTVETKDEVIEETLNRLINSLYLSLSAD